MTKKATPAKSAVAATARKAKPSVHKATPVAAQPAPAAMRIERDTDAGLPSGAPSRALIPYVEPEVVPVGQPVLRMHADGSVEMEMNGTGEESAIVSIAPDGKLRLRCVQASSKPAKVARVAPSVPQPEER